MVQVCTGVPIQAKLSANIIIFVAKIITLWGHFAHLKSYFNHLNCLDIARLCLKITL